MRARLLPKLMAWLLVPWACRIMKKMKAPIRSTGKIEISSVVMMLPAALASTAAKPMFATQSPLFGVPAAVHTSCWTSMLPMSGTTTLLGVSELVTWTVSFVPSWVTDLTLPAFASASIWL